MITQESKNRRNMITFILIRLYIGQHWGSLNYNIIADSINYYQNEVDQPNSILFKIKIIPMHFHTTKIFRIGFSNTKSIDQTQTLSLRID